MREVAAKYPFRIPRYYVENVLRDDPADPLWELALPGKAEIYDAGTERWDAFQLVGKAAEHSRWIQKYRYEVLLRLTNFCSGLCRYCYLKNRENIEGFITHAEIDDMFDQAERSPNKRELREIVLSGGDPLTVPGDYLEHLADRIDRLNASLARRITVTVHTREPVWYPNRVSRTKGLLKGLQRLQPSSYILHVVHPREVTQGLLDALVVLTDLAKKRKPLMMLQHPLFRGINNDARVITEMYDRMDSGDVVVKPYYLIHPFPDGTLPQHRLTLKESQQILRDLASAAGDARAAAHGSDADGEVRHRTVAGFDRPWRLLPSSHQGRRARRIHHRRAVQPRRTPQQYSHRHDHQRRIDGLARPRSYPVENRGCYSRFQSRSHNRASHSRRARGVLRYCRCPRINCGR